MSELVDTYMILCDRKNSKSRISSVARFICDYKYQDYLTVKSMALKLEELYPDMEFNIVKYMSLK